MCVGWHVGEVKRTQWLVTLRVCHTLEKLQCGTHNGRQGHTKALVVRGSQHGKRPSQILGSKEWKNKQKVTMSRIVTISPCVELLPGASTKAGRQRNVGACMHTELPIATYCRCAQRCTRGPARWPSRVVGGGRPARQVTAGQRPAPRRAGEPAGAADWTERERRRRWPPAARRTGPSPCRPEGRGTPNRSSRPRTGHPRLNLNHGTCAVVDRYIRTDESR